MPIRERLKRKSFLISRTNIRNQRKTGFLWNLMDISTWRVFIRLKMDTLELHFLWKELYLVFVGERKDLCVEVRDNETGEVKIHQGTRKSGISTTCVYPLKYTKCTVFMSVWMKECWTREERSERFC
mgnify:CR=1 FL=1